MIQFPLLGSAITGRHLAMADEVTTTAKQAIKRVDRSLGNLRIDIVRAPGRFDSVAARRRAGGLTDARLDRPTRWRASNSVLKLAGAWLCDSFRLGHGAERLLKGSDAGD